MLSIGPGLACLPCLMLLYGRAAAQSAWHRPVRTVVTERLSVATSSGTGEVPTGTSPDWLHSLPGLRRAVIVVHGVDRNADTYLRGTEVAREDAGPDGGATLLIVPQFLADVDTTTFDLPSATLHWSTESWASGEPAHGPTPISSFDVLDAILRRLADRTVFPTLAEVMVVGHSAGGQLVQRYAVVARGETWLSELGIRVRYVIANPCHPTSTSPTIGRRRSIRVSALASITGVTAWWAPHRMSARQMGSRPAMPVAMWSICSAPAIQIRIIQHSTSPVRVRRKTHIVWRAVSPILPI